MNGSILFLGAVPLSCNNFTRVVGKVQKKEEGGEGGEKKHAQHACGTHAQTRDLPLAKRRSPAAHHRSCLDN